MYGRRDGIHFAGKGASTILAQKLEQAMRPIIREIQLQDIVQWFKIDRNRTQNAPKMETPISINPFHCTSEKLSRPRIDWNDIVEEDERLLGQKESSSKHNSDVSMCAC